jgi:hypothetical protein
MTEWELLSRYNYLKMGRDDRHAFEQWQRSAMVTASLFGFALLAMAVTALFSTGSISTEVAGLQATTDGMSTRDLLIHGGHDLPTLDIEDPL